MDTRQSYAAVPGKCTTVDVDEKKGEEICSHSKYMTIVSSSVFKFLLLLIILRFSDTPVRCSEVALGNQSH